MHIIIQITTAYKFFEPLFIFVCEIVQTISAQFFDLRNYGDINYYDLKNSWERDIIKSRKTEVKKWITK